MSTRRTLEVPRTARYHVCAGSGAQVWFGLHGYGQLAGSFLDALAALAPRLLVAPEALSRFYLRRGTGEVGASWMTREERADEIRDTVRYLDLVWDALRAEHALAPEAELHVLGFSQGGAAAARWALLGRAPVARVVSFGCALPQDVDLGAHTGRARSVRWTFALGASDATIDWAAFEAGLARLRGAGIEPEVLRFAGGHELDSATLAQLGSR